jgi:predicted cupin superfamily sugar epimerase
MDEAKDVIARLDLAPHREGGWFRETWRAPSPVPGERGLGTAILFLLEAGQRSHWHRVDATELWLFQAGSALTLFTPEGSTRLGPDIGAGDAPQAGIAPGQWQAAEAGAGWALVACVVVPAFEFSGFELAPPGWEPGSSPA